MTDNFNFLYDDELTVLKLRQLYEDCGYKKYRMSKFESYDLYAKNKDFLVGSKIITFSDLDGKLMALKPDVTLSIVKNAENTNLRQKLYYTENVYRESKDISEFKEISQVGLEVLGDIDLFQTAEIIILAIKSLLEIDSNAILCISHMGYTDGLIDCITNDISAKKEILKLFSSKNSHDLIKLCEENNLPSVPVKTATELMSIKIDNKAVIDFAYKNAICEKMKNAADEINALYTIIEKAGLEKHVSIDLSVTDASSYYNGILMHGYVKDIPRYILSGGRYDLLMSKMGRDGTNAMGFAIYFDALDRKLHKRNEKENTYILYDASSDTDTLLALTQKLSESDIPYNAVTALAQNASGHVYKVCGSLVKEEYI